MTKPHWTLAVWLRIQEPRLISIMQTVIYLLCAWAGTATVLDPPSNIEGQFGVAVTMIWGWFAIVGGVVGAIACPFGKWLIEKPAIILCATAAAMYAGIILTLHIHDDGQITQLCFILIVLLYFASRYVRIRPFSYQPGK